MVIVLREAAREVEVEVAMAMEVVVKLDKILSNFCISPRFPKHLENEFYHVT